MTGKIFRSVLTASVTAMLVVLIIITGVLYSYFGGIQKKKLKTEYTLASEAVELSGKEYLSALDTDNFRLTWVGADGTVLFDTSVDADSMENHSGREEIQEAFLSGSGESERFSSTLTEKTIYYAGLLPDGTVLRISSSHASVLSLVLGMLLPIILVFAFMVILSVVLAKRMAKRIVEPFNNLDLENPLENKAYAELSPLLRRVNTLQGEVDYQLKQLKQKTDEFEQIIGSMNEGLVLLGKSGVIISINNSAMKLFGTDTDCIGRDFLTVDRSVETQEAIAKAYSDGHSEIQSERNGRQYQFDISRIESDENAVGVVILTFDVTEKVFAERNRREFSANVSHELKTPLQSIIGSAELLENKLVKPEDIPRFIGHIRKEAARLVTLIEDIIRLSQLDEGNEMTRENTDLYSAASDVIGELDYAAGEKNISLTLSGEPVIVNGMRKLLYEIIYNLCDNAVKYTDNGGHVEINVRKNGGDAVLTVSDDGIGIDPEHQSRVFERFFRVDKSHSKASGGTGLGLSIVKHAVIYHHGSIGLESKAGKGTVFTVTLPAES